MESWCDCFLLSLYSFSFSSIFPLNDLGLRGEVSTITPPPPPWIRPCLPPSCVAMIDQDHLGHDAHAICSRNQRSIVYEMFKWQKWLMVILEAILRIIYITLIFIFFAKVCILLPASWIHHRDYRSRDLSNSRRQQMFTLF